MLVNKDGKMTQYFIDDEYLKIYDGCRGAR